MAAAAALLAKFQSIAFLPLLLFETYRLAGGEEGMAHFIRQFGPALAWPWTKLMDVPEFDDDLVDLIAGQSDAQSGAYSIRELERRIHALEQTPCRESGRKLRLTRQAAAAVLALGGTLVARGPSGEREIPATEFFTGFLESALAPDELLTAVQHQVPVIWIVENNYMHGITFHGSKLLTPGEPLGCVRQDRPIDIEAIAAGMGLQTWLVERPGQLQPALEQALGGLGAGHPG